MNKLAEFISGSQLRELESVNSRSNVYFWGLVEQNRSPVRSRCCPSVLSCLEAVMCNIRKPWGSRFPQKAVAFVGGSLLPRHPVSLDVFSSYQTPPPVLSLHRLTLTRTSRTGMHLSRALQGTLSRQRSTPAW